MDQFALCSCQVSSGVYLCHRCITLGKYVRNISACSLASSSVSARNWHASWWVSSSFGLRCLVSIWGIQRSLAPLFMGPSSLQAPWRGDVFFGLVPAHRVAMKPPCCAWYLPPPTLDGTSSQAHQLAMSNKRG